MGRRQHELHLEPRTDSRGYTKRYARRWDQPDSADVLDVYDDDDWALMTDRELMPGGSLVCYRINCRSPFTVPRSNAKGTRWLVNKSGRDCGHYSPPPPGGGGGESPKHLWVKNAIAKICFSLYNRGYSPGRPRKEYTPIGTDRVADVCVPEAKVVFEYQTRDRAIRERTRDWQQAGFTVVWLLPEVVTSEKLKHAGWHNPAATLLVQDGDTGTPRKPWREDDDSGANLYVMGSIAFLHPHGGFKNGGKCSAWGFFKDVLNGEREWLSPGSTGLPNPRQGWWVPVT